MVLWQFFNINVLSCRWRCYLYRVAHNLCFPLYNLQYHFINSVFEALYFGINRISDISDTVSCSLQKKVFYLDTVSNPFIISKKQLTFIPMLMSSLSVIEGRTQFLEKKTYAIVSLKAIPQYKTSRNIFMRAVRVFTLDLHFHLRTSKSSIYTIQLIYVPTECLDQSTIEMKIHWNFADTYLCDCELWVDL